MFRTISAYPTASTLPRHKNPPNHQQGSVLSNTIRFSGQNTLNPNDPEEIKILLLDENENAKALAMKVAPKTSNSLVMALIANRIKHRYGSIDIPIFPATQATLLHCAVSQGEPAVVEKLLQMGASPDKTDKNGHTAVDWLNNKFNLERPPKDREAIRLLLENPPELDVEPSWLSNPLPTLSSLAGSISSWLTKPTSDNQASVEASSGTQAPTDQETLEEIAPKTREVGVQVEDEEKKTLQSNLKSQQKESQRLRDSAKREEGNLDELRRELNKQKDENARLQKALSGASRGTNNVQVQRDEARQLLATERAGHELTRKEAQKQQSALEEGFNAKIAELMERLTQQGGEIQKHQVKNQSLQQDLDRRNRELETEKRRRVTELDKAEKAHQATAKHMKSQLENRNRKLQQELAESKAAHEKSYQQMQSSRQETEAGLKAQIEEVRQENRVLAEKLKALESLREQSDAEKNSRIAQFEREHTRYQQELQVEQEGHRKSCTEIKRLEQENKALEESRHLLGTLKQGLIDQKETRIQQLETERARITEALLQKDRQIRTLKAGAGQAEREKERISLDMEIVQASSQEIQAILESTEQEIQQHNDPEKLKRILLQALQQIREENRVTQGMLEQNSLEESESATSRLPALKRSWSFS